MIDPTTSTLRFRIETGASVSVIWLAVGSPSVAEIAARAQPDAIVLDAQHGLWDRAGMEHAIGLAAPVPVLESAGAGSSACAGAGAGGGSASSPNRSSGIA